VTDVALKLNVLYVDDDPVNLRVLGDMLGACGMTVTCAASGSEALQWLGMQAFDVVLMDLHMPGLNGTQTLHELRKSPGMNRDAPVVVVTADPSVEREAGAMGFTGFLAKPVSMKAALAAILGALSTHSPRANLRR